MPIDYEKYTEFNTKFAKNGFPNQRYGQAFCNHFNITDSDIFYQEDKDLAATWAFSQYVVW